MAEHVTTITEQEQWQAWTWLCICGVGGGPYDVYEDCAVASVAHVENPDA